MCIVEFNKRRREHPWESDDAGHAWKEITPTAFQPQAVAVQPLAIISIGADGSLIAAVNQSNRNVADRFNLYRLPWSGSTWEPIGPAPNSNGAITNGTRGFQAYPSGAIVYLSGQFYITIYP